MKRNLLKVDPTRTITLRRRLIQQVRLWFRRLQAELERSGFDRMTLPEFDSFLRFQVNNHVLGRYHELVWGKYTLDLFRKGIERVYQDVPQRSVWPGHSVVGTSISGMGLFDADSLRGGDYTHAGGGGQDQGVHGQGISGVGSTSSYLHGFSDGAGRGFTRAVLCTEATGAILKSLKDRAWGELKGSCEELIKRCKRALSDGILKTLSSKEVLSRIDSVFRVMTSRVTTIVNSELIRAFAEGQLSAMEHLNVSSALVNAEWVSGDVDCPGCSKMEGKSFSVKEGRGMIPFHPNCRCCWRIGNGRN